MKKWWVALRWLWAVFWVELGCFHVAFLLEYQRELSGVAVPGVGVMTAAMFYVAAQVLLSLVRSWGLVWEPVA